jgi:hypothetical protein
VAVWPTATLRWRQSHHHSSTGPVRVSLVDDISTQETSLEQIYLLLHVMPRSSLVGVCSQKCNSASHQHRNSALDRGCIDRNVLRRGRVCKVVHCFTVTWYLSSGYRPLEEAWPRYQNTTFIYIFLCSLCTLYTYWSNWMNTTTVFWLHSINIMFNTLALWLLLHYSSQRLGSPSPSPRVKLSVCLTLSGSSNTLQSHLLGWRTTGWWCWLWQMMASMVPLHGSKDWRSLRLHC